MRTNILEKYPSSDARVYAIWFNMMTGDSRNLVDLRVLDDHRVTNYYDADRVVGSWFGAHDNGDGGIAWDAYYLYGRGATWSAEPGPLLSNGGPVIDSSADLAAAFGRVVQPA